MKLTLCPDRQELVAYVAGRLTEETTEALADHIDACPACQSVMATLDEADDTLVVRLRRAPTINEYEQDPAYRMAAIQAKALVPAAGPTADNVPDGPPSPESSPAGIDSIGDLGTLGEYQLLAKLGEGGMGAVYKARQARLKRIVALKVLPKERTADPSAVARFEREMEAVGRLNHPNIVQAYDARDCDGTTVLVMEYVEGMDLGQVVLHLRGLAIADACELVRQTALGLQSAYENGLVHRDIKPSNIMLTQRGQVKILDMGLALLGAEQPGSGELTSAGSAMGTADYMAPQQVSDAHSVDIRADIYSLGCTLYKLLSGRAPFTGPQYKSHGEKLTGHLRDTPPSIRLLRTDVSAELAAVIERMMAKNPAERFSTPAEVAAAMTPFATGCDLARMSAEAAAMARGIAETDKSHAATDPFLPSSATGTHPSDSAAEIVEGIATVPLSAFPPSPPAARPLSAMRRALKQPFAAVAVGLVGVAILFGIILRIKDRAGRETVLTLPEGSEVTIEEQPSRAAPVPATNKGKMPVPPDTVAGVAAEPQTSALAIGPPLPRPKPVPLNIAPEPLDQPPGAPMSRMALVAQPASIPGVRSWTVETYAHRGAATGLAYAPDGRWLATACADGMIRLWEADSGTLIRVLAGHDGGVNSLCWSPDGKYLASGGDDKTIRFWDPHAGRLLRTRDRHVDKVKSVAWSPDGRYLASAGAEKVIQLWDAARGEPARELLGHGAAVSAVAWSPDGKTLASAGADNTIRFWNVENGEPRHVIKTDCTWALAWSPDGRLLASSLVRPSQGRIACVSLWDAQSGNQVDALMEQNEGVASLAFSPSGAQLLCGGSYLAPPVSAYDLVKRERVVQQGMSRPDATKAIFSPRGQRSVIAQGDGVVAFLEGTTGKALRKLPACPGRIASLGWSVDGKLLASGSATGWMQLWDLEQCASIGCARLEVDVIRGLSLSPDGQSFSYGYGVSGVAVVWDAKAMKKKFSLDTGNEVVDFTAWSPSGKLLATSGRNRGHLFDGTSGERIAVLPGRGDCPTWSPDGRLLAFRASRMDVVVYDRQSGQVARTFAAATVVTAIAWSGDARKLAYGTDDARVVLVDAGSGGTLGSLADGHQTAIRVLRWKEDNKTLISGSAEGLCHWDTQSGKILRKWSGVCHSISPSGSLIAGQGPSVVQLRHADDGHLIETLLSLPNPSYAHGILSPIGHWRGTMGMEKDLVYVALTDKGEQLTLTPEEFSKKYGWKNDPEKVSLTGEGGRGKGEKAEPKGEGRGEKGDDKAPEPSPLPKDQPAAGTQRIKTFDTTARPITQDGVTAQQGAWRIEAKEHRTVRLFEVADPGVENCVVTYRAKIKTENLEGQAYLEMWCRLPGGGEFFSKGITNPVKGTTDWASYETPFTLKAGQGPDLIKLNLVIEGKGTLWIKDVELLKGPLPQP